ncbi:MAG: SIS domain-containing protein [Bacilli bacterium]
MGYYFDYCDDIIRGLKGLCVTDGKGNTIDHEKAFDIFASKVKQVSEESGFVFFCGNGASCTMAEHMSHDFFQNAFVNTQTCAETAHITAISNDISYEDVFAFRIKRIMRPIDAIVAISSSGNSKNILKAVQSAKENGSFVITISGKKEDNSLRKMGNLNFYVKLDTYGMVESAHAVLLHSLLDYYLDKFYQGRH